MVEEAFWKNLYYDLYFAIGLSFGSMTQIEGEKRLGMTNQWVQRGKS